MEISGETRIYAVVADPVFQLRTPEFINPIFKRIGANVVALPLHVTSADLPVIWRALRAIGNLAGIGVAMPHKAAAAELCDRLDSTAEVLRVVSAVRRQRDGTMIGAALDGVGFVDGLRKNGHELAGKRVLMLGAGGAATANAFALLKEGIHSLTVVNRTAEKALSLVRRLNEHSIRAIARTGDPDPRGFDVIINTTSLGLKAADRLPLAADSLAPTQLVVDIVAQPAMTRFLLLAQAKGCAIHSGVHTIASHMERVAQFICHKGPDA